jgi:hypothetical protein
MSLVDFERGGPLSYSDTTPPEKLHRTEIGCAWEVMAKRRIATAATELLNRTKSLFDFNPVFFRLIHRIGLGGAQPRIYNVANLSN